MSRNLLLVVIVFGIIVLLAFSGSLIEVNRAGHYQVMQSVMGNMSCRLEPGPYPQWLGRVDTYKQVVTVGFGEEYDGDEGGDIPAIPVVFEDNTKATISGLIRIELPADKDKMIVLKQKYSGGLDNVIQSLIVPVVTNTVMLSANLRDSQNAYTATSQLQADIEDQLRNGNYKTRTQIMQVENALGEKEQKKITTIVKDEEGNPIRLANQLAEWGLMAKQVTIAVPLLDDTAAKAMEERKNRALETENAKQQALTAEQRAKTAEAEGKALVMKEKYEQEQLKIRAVVQAEQDKEVAEVEAKKKVEVARQAALEAEQMKIAAAQKKQEQILLGEGEATRKKLVMEADGALAQKLQTLVAVNQVWADAYKERAVPTTVIGGGDTDKATLDLQNLMAIKLARDLSLDMSVKTN